MSKELKNNLITLFLCFSLSLSAYSNISGYIKGTLLIDDSWEQIIYISLIETFEKKFAISDKMIIESSPLDSNGGFTIKLDNLPSEWCLLRLHVIKKGNPPASLLIGGLDENYYFIIANRYSRIVLYNTLEKPIFDNLFISGAPYMNTVQYITNLLNFLNSMNYENSLIEKEFMEEVVFEKLKLIADTCENSLVSLYSLYQIDFHADYEKNPTFYKEYLSKWRNNNSPYFKSFRRQLPLLEKPGRAFILMVLFIAVFVLVIILIRDRKRRKIKKLSVQERRVFKLLQKGASNQEISDEYNIELSTVKSHVSNIFSKLNIKSRKEAVNLKMK
jgi:DNA-binding CsgD family transcriptional regulator